MGESPAAQPTADSRISARYGERRAAVAVDRRATAARARGTARFRRSGSGSAREAREEPGPRQRLAVDEEVVRDRAVAGLEPRLERRPAGLDRRRPGAGVIAVGARDRRRDRQPDVAREAVVDRRPDRADGPRVVVGLVGRRAVVVHRRQRRPDRALGDGGLELEIGRVRGLAGRARDVEPVAGVAGVEVRGLEAREALGDGTWPPSCHACRWA